jgi:hypothetical protein
MSSALFEKPVEPESLPQDLSEINRYPQIDRAHDPAVFFGKLLDLRAPVPPSQSLAGRRLNATRAGERPPFERMPSVHTTLSDSPGLLHNRALR